MAKKKPKSKPKKPTRRIHNNTLKKGRFIAAYLESANVSQAARSIGVGRNVHYGWMREDPDYKKRFDEAKNETLDAIEESLWRRSVHGAARLKFHEGQMIMVPDPAGRTEPDPEGRMIVDAKGRKTQLMVPVMVPYVEYTHDTTAAIFLLKAGRPKKYRENLKIEQKIELETSGADTPLPTKAEMAKILAELTARLPEGDPDASP